MAEYDKSLQYNADTQTLVGERKRQIMDMETGEVMLVDQITKRRYGTKNFWKCYLMDFLTVLESSTAASWTFSCTSPRTRTRATRSSAPIRKFQGRGRKL